MKPLFTTFLFAVLIFSAKAQNTLYQDIKNKLAATHSEIDLENKLIAFNVWSVDDNESRELNKQFEKTYAVYQSALLKGGRKGLVVISINKENLSSTAVITYTKDGINKLIPFKLSEFESVDSSFNNGVFDSNGNEVYRNLNAQNVYSSIHHLITR